jgi:hypothetical protein
VRVCAGVSVPGEEGLLGLPRVRNRLKSEEGGG